MTGLFRRAITHRWYTGGEMVKGRWVEGTFKENTIQASVQPLTAHQIQMLPEGRRNSKSYSIYTNADLGMKSEENPHSVIIDEEEYEIVYKSPWQNKVISHYQYLVVKRDNE